MLTAEIDLSVLVQNVKNLRNRTRAKFCAVVKADAYGHGAVAIAKAIEKNVDEFAVSTASEAYELICAKIQKPINILSPYNRDEMADAFSFCQTLTSIVPTISSVSELNSLKKSNFFYGGINVKINSGMNRLGIEPKELDGVIKQARKSGIIIKSVFSHLYNSFDLMDCKTQLEAFNSCTQKTQFTRHIAASGFLNLPKEFQLDMVRCGISMYGYSDITLPIMKIHTDIIKTAYVKKGSHIGYGEFVTDKNVKVAVIRVGYADGFMRKRTGEKRYVEICGKSCEILGQICMDACMADITNINAKVGDRAYILGNIQTARNYAKNANTIDYEVLTGFNHRRIKKIYV